MSPRQPPSTLPPSQYNPIAKSHTFTTLIVTIYHGGNLGQTAIIAGEEAAVEAAAFMGVAVMPYIC